MSWLINPNWQTIVYGLATGLVFGFALQKAHVTRYGVILGQFLLKDFTVLKVMLTAIITGAIGIWAMQTLDMGVAMHIKSALLMATIVGGLIFGVGMATLGYCPGTGVAAIGDGSRHAIPGLIGMIVGGGIYAHVYPHIMDNFLNQWTVAIDGSSKVTLAGLTHLSPWWFIAALIVIAAILFTVIERHERRRA